LAIGHTLADCRRVLDQHGSALLEHESSFGRLDGAWHARKLGETAAYGLGLV